MCYAVGKEPTVDTFTSTDSSCTVYNSVSKIFFLFQIKIPIETHSSLFTTWTKLKEKSLKNYIQFIFWINLMIWKGEQCQYYLFNEWTGNTVLQCSPSIIKVVWLSLSQFSIKNVNCAICILSTAANYSCISIFKLKLATVEYFSFQWQVSWNLFLNKIVSSVRRVRVSEC